MATTYSAICSSRSSVGVESFAGQGLTEVRSVVPSAVALSPNLFWATQSVSCCGCVVYRRLFCRSASRQSSFAGNDGRHR